MPPESRAAALCEQAEAIVEPRRELLQSERRSTRRRQFEGERNAVEASTNCCDERGSFLMQREVRVCGPDPRGEQGYRAISQHGLQRRILRWNGERRQAAEPLALCSEWLAACREHACGRIGVQQGFDHLRRGINHMLTVVEHQQDVL